MVAVPLIFGALSAEHYEDQVAHDPRIDALRAKMEVRENPDFTRDYFDPDKRYIGNAITVHYSDGSQSERIQVDFPIGHRRRRAEGIPVLERKFDAALRQVFPRGRADRLRELFADSSQLDNTSFNEFMTYLSL
jgi:2-methylcitrate dehydratase